MRRWMVWCLVLPWASLSWADSGCEQVAQQRDMAAILVQCPNVAAAGDANANFAMGLAILAQQTQVFIEKPTADHLDVLEKQWPAIFKAQQYLKTAAAQGHVEANFMLGGLMVQTMPLQTDHRAVEYDQLVKEAHSYLKVAATHGIKEALMVLADNAVTYNFLPPHQVESVDPDYESYLRAVVADPELSTPYWQSRLRDYEAYQAKQTAMERDVSTVAPSEAYAKARELFFSDDAASVQRGTAMLRQLSKQGYGDASYNLALLEQRQHGKDQVLALMEQAAAQHSHRAMLWLGDYYGCRKAPKKALQWYEKAKAAGNKDADFGINEIKQYGNVADCG